MATEGAPSNRSRLKPALILFGMFALGGVAGVAVTRAMMIDELRLKMEGPPGEARANFRLEAMRRRLDLSDDQVSAIGAVMKDAESGRDAALGPCRADLDRTRQATDAKILELLTEDQQARFKESEAKRRERRGPPPR